MEGFDVEIAVVRVTAISIPTTTTVQEIVSGRCWLAGWSLRETTGAAPAQVEFTSGGNPVAESSMLANASDTHFVGNNGVIIASDVTLNVISGSVRGAVYVAIGR